MVKQSPEVTAIQDQTYAVVDEMARDAMARIDEFGSAVAIGQVADVIDGAAKSGANPALMAAAAILRVAELLRGRDGGNR